MRSTTTFPSTTSSPAASLPEIAGSLSVPQSITVLFDLDGTLADTAPDMARALNRVRSDEGLAPLPLEHLRAHASSGARGMLGVGFGISPDHVDYEARRVAFLAYYERALCVETRLFDGVPQLLAQLRTRRITWGIVTNKASRYTQPLLQALGLDRMAGCIVCGDTCARAKPFPDPLLHASHLLAQSAAQCWYVGDDVRDIEAARAAGMRSMAAAYGYLGASNPVSWGADTCVATPAEILSVLCRTT